MTTIAGPTSARCDLTLRPSATAFGFNAGSGTIEIDTARECEWNASSDAPWISLKPTSGQGRGTTQFSIGANDQSGRRVGAILVNDRRVDFSQDGAPCRIQFATARATLGFDGGDGVLSIATLDGCRWTATTSASWIELRNPVSGAGNGTVRFQVQPNDGAERVGAIRVGDSEQAIAQQPAPGPPNPPAPLDCLFTISPDAVDIAADGGTASVAIVTDSGCAWMARASADWIALLNSSGTGTGRLQFAAQVNSGGARRASIQIANRTVAVSQTAAPGPSPTPPSPSPPPPIPPAPSCSLELDPSTGDVTAAGGDGRIRVRAPDACSWSARSQSGWIVVTAGASGDGDGEVRYRVAPNTDTRARTGSVAVGDRTFILRQDAATPAPPPPPSCTFDVDRTQESFGAEGGELRIKVRAQAQCTWTASSNVSWMTVTAGASGKGNGDVRIRVSANSDAARTGTLDVAERTVTVSQASPPPPPTPTPTPPAPPTPAPTPPSPAPAPPPPPPSCSFRVDPDSENFHADGGENRIRVRTTGACAWTATSQSVWITIVAGASGQGDGDVRYRVAANAGGARTGAITIADQTVAIRQEAAEARDIDLEGQVAQLEGSCPNVTFVVGGTTFHANADTRYDDGSCGSLRNGVKVRAEGRQLSSGGPVTATRIRFRT